MKKYIYPELPCRAKWLGFAVLLLLYIFTHAQDVIIYKSVEDFNFKVNGYVPFYVNNKYLAINPLQHEDKAGAAICTFDGSKHGIYTVEIKVKQEYDGESKYRLIIAGKEHDKLSYNRVPEDKEKDTTLVWKDVTVLKGDKIKIEAQSNSNGLYPEQGAPGGYAWSRGRWSQLKLTLVEPVPVVAEIVNHKSNRSVKVFSRDSRLYLAVPFGEEYTLTLYSTNGKALARYERDARCMEPVLLYGLGQGAFIVSVSSATYTFQQKVVVK